MDSKEQKEILTLDKIVELPLKLEMTPEERKTWIEDQHKKNKDMEREERAERRRYEEEIRQQIEADKAKQREAGEKLRRKLEASKEKEEKRREKERKHEMEMKDKELKLLDLQAAAAATKETWSAERQKFEEEQRPKDRDLQLELEKEKSNALIRAKQIEMGSKTEMDQLNREGKIEKINPSI